MKAFYLLLATLLPGLQAVSQNLQRDITFNDNDTTANSSTRCLAIQPDGKIVFFGDNKFYDGVWPHGTGIPIEYGGRLNPDGSWDPSFAPIQLDGRIDDIEIQSFDQKIIIVGSFTRVNNIPRRGVCRLNTDGTVDATFQPGAGIRDGIATDRVWAVELKESTNSADRRIILGGDFEYYDNQLTGSVIRIHMDGSLDNSYQPQVMDDGVVYDMEYDQAHDELYIGGEFYYVGSIPKWRLAKLRFDGSLDENYKMGATRWNTFHNSVTSLYLNTDGKILAGGYFDMVNGVVRGGLARVNLDGTLDMNFNTGQGFRGGVSKKDLPGTEVRSMLVLHDGAVVVAGNFTSFNGVPCGNIVKLKPDGNADSSTVFGFGFNDVVMDIKLQRQPSGEEKIVGGGFFAEYNHEFQGAIMRLVPEIVLAGEFIRAQAVAQNKGALIKWTTNLSDPVTEVTIERSLDGIHYEGIQKANLNSFGRTGNIYYFRDPALPGNTVYYRLKAKRNEVLLYSNIERVSRTGSDASNIFVYPNPVGKTLFLRSSLNASTNCHVEIFDSKGTLLKSWPINIPRGLQVNQVTMPALPDQQLFLRIRDGMGNILVVTQLYYISSKL